MKLRTPRVLRDEVRGVLRPPREIQEFMLRVGGYTPFGEAMYRMEWAENIYQLEGGIWTEWDDDVPVSERGGLYSTATPKSVTVDLREVLRYPGMVGWIIERWESVDYFGGKQSWEAAKVPGTDIPFLGPLNEHGRYVLVSGPSVEMPTTLDIKGAIEQVEWNKDQHHGSVERATQEALNDATYRYEEEGRKLRERAEATFRDAMSPWHSTGLAAGRWRNEMAKRAGITEHAGN